MKFDLAIIEVRGTTLLQMMGENRTRLACTDTYYLVEILFYESWSIWLQRVHRLKKQRRNIDLNLYRAIEPGKIATASVMTDNVSLTRRKHLIW